jgi:hypothetical protein
MRARRFRNADEDPAAGLRGEVTGRIRVGRYVLEVGDSAGSRLQLASDHDEAADASELATALEKGEASAAERVEGTVDTVAEVTRGTQRALELFVALATGRLDAPVVARELEALAARLRTLDRAGRFDEVLPLARALAAALALALRWAALVETLRIALHAARELGDRQAEARALHELGTLAVPAGAAEQARELLDNALSLRQAIGDHSGARLTTHNLREAGLAPPSPPSHGPGRAKDWIVAHAAPVAAGAAVVAGAGTAGLFVGDGWYGLGGGGGASAEILGFAAVPAEREGAVPDEVVEPGGTVRACKISRLYDFTRYAGMREGTHVTTRSLREGRVFASSGETWSGPRRSVRQGSAYYRSGGVLRPGRWELTVIVEEEELDRAGVNLESSC